MKKCILVLMILLAAGIFAANLTAQSSSNSVEWIGYSMVVTDDGSNLNMRDNHTNGKVIAKIPCGRTISVSNKKTGLKATIGGLTDYWYYVRYYENEALAYEGWVFGGYLSKIIPEFPFEIEWQYKGSDIFNFAEELNQNKYDLIVNGNAKAVLFFIATDIIDINKQYENKDGSQKKYPAEIAMERNSDVAVLKLILQKVGDSKKNPYLKQLMFTASKEFRPDYMEIILNNSNVNVNSLDENHHTALWNAVNESNYETAYVLLQNGADPSLGDQSALEYAENNKWFKRLLNDSKSISEHSKNDFYVHVYYQDEDVYKKSFTVDSIDEFDEEGRLILHSDRESHSVKANECFYSYDNNKITRYSSNKNRRNTEKNIDKAPVSKIYDTRNKWNNSWTTWEETRNDKDQIVKYVREDGLTQFFEYDGNGNLKSSNGWGFAEYYDNEYYPDGKIKRITRYGYGYNTGDM